MSRKIVTRRPAPFRPESHHCITRIITHEPKVSRGWEVRVVRRGIAIMEYFADRKFGGKAGALSEAMHFRDRIVRELPTIPRSELARRKTTRNTSGIPGVRRRIKPQKKGTKTFEYVVWSASATPIPGKRKTRDFYVSQLGEDDAREAAIEQRLRWEKQMVRNERHAKPKRKR